MKYSTILLATLSLAIGFVQAQTVPLFINYQGKVTDSNGIGVGTGSPVNRKMLFRLWSHPSDAAAGNLLWTEEQTVTILNGEFSVLLGQGINGTGVASGEARGPLESVFTIGGTVSPSGPLRYLEITVDNGDNVITAADTAITPRQQITTTAYSFRSSIADTVKGLSIDTNALAANSVTTVKIADNSINNFKIVDGAVNNAKIADNSINSAKIQDLSIGTADLGDSSVTTSKIAASAVTVAKLDPGIGVWSVSGANVYRSGGMVGIGKVPALPLDVVGAFNATGDITTGSSMAAGGNLWAQGNINCNGAMATAGNFSCGSFVTSGAVNATGDISTANNIWVQGAVTTGGNIGVGGNLYASNILTTANVGVGTTAPGFPLTFSQSIGDKIALYTGVSGTSYGVGVQGSLLQIHTDAVSADIAFGYGSSASMTETMRIKGNGRVGIGTNNPFVPLHVATSVSYVLPNTQGDSIDGFDAFGYNGILGGTLTRNFSILADQFVGAMGFYAKSDYRIKKEVTTSSQPDDLTAIQQLRVTDYKMVDHIEGGSGWRKGFIAQEVEAILPEAVSRSVNFIPDIFSHTKDFLWLPDTKSLSVTLSRDHTLKVGDRVRLQVDTKTLELEVTTVPSAREFAVAGCSTAPEKVFVYGKQVNDFRTVDYDHIFTTSVSALQQLKQEKDAEVKTLQEENACLRERLAALDADNVSRDAKLESLEKLVLSIKPPDTRTVSIKAGE